jgi:hypothetical protein
VVFVGQKLMIGKISSSVVNMSALWQIGWRSGGMSLLLGFGDDELWWKRLAARSFQVVTRGFAAWREARLHQKLGSSKLTPPAY